MEEQNKIRKKIEVEVTEPGRKKSSVWLTEKNEQFLQFFIFDSELNGNATQSYIRAYNLDPKKKKDVDSANAAASRLLKRNDIIKRLHFLTKQSALSLPDIYPHLLWLARQKGNLTVSLGATKAIISEIHRYEELSGLNKSNYPKVIKTIEIETIPGRQQDIQE